MAMEAQDSILKWYGIPTTLFDNIVEFVNFATTWGNCPTKRKRINVVSYALLWFIRLARNNRVFKGLHTNPDC